MEHAAEHEIAVVGGGLSGLAVALGIGRTGRRVAHVDPDGGRQDARTTAMLGPTIEMLRAFGIWSVIEPHCAPLRTMRIIDGSRRLVRAPTVRFEASEIGQTEFGWNVPNVVAAAAMREALEAMPNVRRHSTLVERVDVGDVVTTTLEDGTAIRSALVVGADGRNSIVRKTANIPSREWRYPQSALVTTFEHEVSHGDVSTEFHTENGPATQVPLPGKRSSLVWVGAPQEIAALAELEPEALAGAIEARIAHTLGSIKVDGPVQTFPMAAHIAQAYSGARTMLVGEAAHGFPPIGAQGFNLSMRDVRDCIEVQRDAADPGAPAQVTMYDRLRLRDAQLRTLGVDALNRSLLSDLVPVQAAKAIGLAALKALPPLRQVVMRQGFRPSPIRSPSAVLGDLANRVRERRADYVSRPR